MFELNKIEQYIIHVTTLLQKFTKAAVTTIILSMVATSVSAGLFINEIGNVP